MKIDLVCLCRGFGYSYALITVEDIKNEKLVFRFMRGKEEFPCIATVLKENENSRSYIVQSPLLKDNSLLYCVILDDLGQVLQKKRFFLFSFRTAWQSKLEGRLKKEECALIRNSNLRFARKEAAQIDFQGLLFHCEGWCLKGFAAIRCSRKQNLKFKAFDNFGRKLEVVLLSNEIDQSAENAENFIRVAFVIKIKKIKSSIYLGIFDSCLGAWLASECLTKEQIRLFRRIHIATFTDAFNDSRYPQWFLSHRVSVSEIERQRNYSFAIEPKFSIIVPLYKTPLLFFYEMIESVLCQTYRNWELVLVNASPEDFELSEAIKDVELLDTRIKVITLKENQGITENTNEGIKGASGDYLCFFDHDDTLEPDLLFEYALAINSNPDVDLLYCDEDKLIPNGTYANPTFKPDFNLDLLRDNNYICHLLTVKKTTHAKLIPATKELDGAQDHSLALQVAEKNGVFCHVPKILYHWRISETSTAANANSKPYATEAGIYALSEHLKRMGINAKVECAHNRAFRYKVNYELTGNPLVSVVVTTRAAKSKETVRFLKEISNNIGNFNIEFVVPDVSCFSSTNMKYLSQLDRKVVVYEADDTLVKEINCAVKKSSGNYCFIIAAEMIGSKQEDWFETLLAHCLRSEVGIVGSMIVDKADFIIEAGLTVVGDDKAVRLSSGQYYGAPGYIYRPLSTQEVYAVGLNGAMVAKDLLEKNPLSEELSLDENSILLSEEVSNEGFRVVYTPESILICCDEIADVFPLTVEKKRFDKFFNPNCNISPECAIHYGLGK